MSTKALAITLPADLAEQLAQEAERTGAEASTVVQYALEEYLYEQQRARAFALEDDCND